MKHNRMRALLAVFLAMSLTPSSIARAEEATEADGDISVYVKAVVTAPTDSTTFHTGGQQTVNIDYQSQNQGRMTPNGNQQSGSTWRVICTLTLTPTETLDFESTAPTGDLYVPANSTTAVSFSPTLAHTFATPAGGHTCLSTTLVEALTAGYSNHDIADNVSFTVVNP